jgi:hypothetical protein
LNKELRATLKRLLDSRPAEDEDDDPADLASPESRKRPEEAWFDVQLMQKGIRLALQGNALGLLLPAAATTDEILTEARERGYGGSDLAAPFPDDRAMSGGSTCPADPAPSW